MNIIETGETDGKIISKDSINKLANETLKICEKVIVENLNDLDDEEKNSEIKEEVMKSQALIKQSEALNTLGNYEESEKRLESAFMILNKYHIELTAEQWNLKANIELQHGHFPEALKFVQNAIQLKNNEGNFYDTLAEIYFKLSSVQKENDEKQQMMQKFYNSLDSALKYPNVHKGITIEGEKSDQRWKEVWKTNKFLEIMNK